MLLARWKAVEIARMKERLPLARLMMQLNAAQPARDFIGALRGAQARIGKPGLIAEVKKASPSRGVIQPNFDPVRVRFNMLYLPHPSYLSDRGCELACKSIALYSIALDAGVKPLPRLFCMPALGIDILED